VKFAIFNFFTLANFLLAIAATAAAIRLPTVLVGSVIIALDVRQLTAALHYPLAVSIACIAGAIALVAILGGRVAITSNHNFLVAILIDDSIGATW
jgi:hypothetical protein